MKIPDSHQIFRIVHSLIRIAGEEHDFQVNWPPDNLMMLGDLLEDKEDSRCEMVRSYVSKLGESWNHAGLEGLQIRTDNVITLTEILYSLLYFVPDNPNPWYEFTITPKGITIEKICGEGKSETGYACNRIDPHPYIRKGCPHFYQHGLACVECGYTAANLMFESVVPDDRFRRSIPKEIVVSELTKGVFEFWVRYALTKKWTMNSTVLYRVFCTTVLYVAQTANYVASTTQTDPIRVLRSLEQGDTYLYYNGRRVPNLRDGLYYNGRRVPNLRDGLLWPSWACHHSSTNVRNRKPRSS